jgi:hypothetical protein
MLKGKIWGATALVMLTMSPVFAGAFWGPPRHSGSPPVSHPGPVSPPGGAVDNPSGNVVGAPGPIAGVGLPVLVVAGGYLWIRRRRSKRLGKPTD